MTPANDRTGVGAGSGDWRTPPDLYARLDRRNRFTYDPFASHATALCDRYSTLEGTFETTPGSGILPRQFEGAGTGYRQVDELNGLDHPWEGERVFCNPPYGRGLVEQAVTKMFTERNSAALIVALLPASPDTHWFQRFILPHAHIDWLPRRVHFIHPDVPCIKRDGSTCTHALGAPLRDTPSGSVVALFKADLMPYALLP